jgi:hypothetical protein
MTKFLATIFGVAGVFLIIILLSLLFIKLGWMLFMVPVFNLPDLTWMQALGFSFLASAFRASSASKST